MTDYEQTQTGRINVKKIKTRQSQAPKWKFHKVLDTKGNPVLNLWLRNGRYYAQITLTEEGRQKNTKRSLKANTLTGAREELEDLKFKRRNNQLAPVTKLPRFHSYCDDYMQHQRQIQRKKASSLRSERGHIKHWKRCLGDIRLNKINPSLIRKAMGAMRERGLAPQTVNYALITLRCILIMAVEDQLLPDLPVAPKMWLKAERLKRPPFLTDEMERLCESALACSRNGEQFVRYFKFMCFCGARAGEALRVKWANVDFDNRQVVIGADGNTKNGKSRVVDFNDNLEALLVEMHHTRSSDQWLFVSAQRGSEGRRARSFRETLLKARERVGLGNQRREDTGYALAFHDCRHYFISYSVMSGVDFLTVAIWVGHQDGGLLISRVYGHVSNEHLKASARKVCFKPQLIEEGLSSSPQESIAS
jgi:integrase